VSEAEGTVEALEFLGEGAPSAAHLGDRRSPLQRFGERCAAEGAAQAVGGGVETGEHDLGQHGGVVAAMVGMEATADDIYHCDDAGDRVVNGVI
jgi:hypothetical protein